jgi:thiol-disulfide isomerase/thioredoxin
VAQGEFAARLRGFPGLLGDLLSAPGRALGVIETAGRGGFGLLVTWCLFAAIALRFVNLADAVVGFQAGGGLRVVSVLVSELTQAIPAALGAALAIVVLAGAKRDPATDLELGCAAAVPFLVARAFFRTAVILVGREPPLRLVQASYAVAGAWALVLVGAAIRVARRRPTRPTLDSTPRQRRWSRAAGWAAISALVAGLAGSVVWTVRNTSALGPVSRGEAAPDFTLPRVDGKPGTVTLSSLRGQVVVLDFWATWCPPCLEALPMMHALSRELETKGVTFVGVDSDGAQTSPADVTAFLAEHGAPYAVVYDDGTANERYRIRVLPTVVIVGRSGAIERVFIGSTGRGTLLAAVEAARTR